MVLENNMLSKVRGKRQISNDLLIYKAKDYLIPNWNKPWLLLTEVRTETSKEGKEEKKTWCSDRELLTLY